MTFYDLKKSFLTFFGDLKYFKTPPCIVYQPTTFKIKGSDTREAMSLIEAGDIILRGYSCYLDGLFIPGKYSHTGLYVGEGKMIHAIAEGVSEIDIIDFLRCDRFCILRPAYGQSIAIERAKEYMKRNTPYDFDFETWNNKMYCHELVAQCYHGLKIDKKTPTLLRGLIRGNPAWLADSFLLSPDFKLVQEK